MTHDSRQNRLDRLRGFRNRPERDVSLGFLQQQFKREVEKPYKQVGQLATLWENLVPEELAAHTRLESFTRGILTVSVDSSARLYELDGLLRGGLERELIRRHSLGSLRQVRLRVNAPLDEGG